MTKAAIKKRLAHPIPQERPWATALRYRPTRDEIDLTLDGGARLVVPRKAVDELRRLPKSHMRQLELLAGGEALSLRIDDIDIYVPGLVRDLIGFGTAALPAKRRVGCPSSG